MKYTVEIVERLIKEIEVEAESEIGAIIIAEGMYYGSDVVLDSNDHFDTNFHAIGEIM